MKTNQIAQKLGLLNSSLSFNTLEELKNSNVVKVGDTVSTRSYSELGGRGGAQYQILSKDTSSEIDTVTLNNGLVGKIIFDGPFRSSMIGIGYGSDDTSLVKDWLTFCAKNKIKAILDSGKVVIENVDVELLRGHNLDFKAESGSVLLSNSTELGSSALSIHGRWISEANTNLNGTPHYRGSKSLNLSDDVSGLVHVGDLVHIRSTRVIQTEPRGGDREGHLNRVEGIDGNVITLTQPLRIDLEEKNFSATVGEVISSSTITLPDLNQKPRDVQALIRFSSGTYTYITRWDNTTKQATLGNNSLSITPGESVTIEWYTQINFIESCTASMHSFNMTREMHLDANPGDLGYIGLNVWGVDNFQIKDWKISNFSGMNLKVDFCFRPYMANGEAPHANRSYNGYDGHGYGISIGSSTEPFVDGLETWGCRRGVDFGGIWQTWDGIAKDVRSHGGGKTYVGGDFFPYGDGGNQCVGSHGCGYGTKYINCQGIDVESTMNLRGLNEQVIDCSLVGAAKIPILVQAGGGYKISNFIYDSGGSNKVARGDQYSSVLPDALRPGELMRVFCDKVDFETPIDLQGTRAYGISNAMIYLDRNDVGRPPSFILGNNQAFPIDKEGTTSGEYFYFIRSWTSRDGFEMIDLGGNGAHLGESEFDEFNYLNLNRSGLYTLYNVPAIIGPNLYTVRLELNHAARVRLPNAAQTLKVSVWDQERDRPYSAMDVLLYFSRGSDYSPLNDINKRSVEVLGTELLGETGPVGSINIAYVGNYFYIENRIDDGSLKKPVFKFEYM